MSNKELDNLIKRLMEKPEYGIELKPLTKKERRDWAMEFLDNYNIKILNDTLFKFIFSGNDEESQFLIQFIFKNYLDIDVVDFVKTRNELNRQSRNSKTSILDCLYSVESLNMIIDIEPQITIDDNKLMPKFERYLAMLRVFEKNIGNKDESKYAFLHLICFYETIYQGDYINDIVVESKDGYKIVRNSDSYRGADMYTKQDIRIVELEKAVKKFEKEGIENMNEREWFEYTMAKSHVLNDTVQKFISKMAQRSLAVRYLLNKKDEFLAKPENRYISVKYEMDLNTQYWQGHNHGEIEGIEQGIEQGINIDRETQRQKAREKVIFRYTGKYDSDISFLEGLSLEAYEHIDDLIYAGSLSDEIKSYALSLKV
ncbi:MAG: hypothetical protein LUG12_02240 [Erysipelotrichaceae bacterium]|nr:hypothetical protein [Erysipelotrichaceae bacterium]